MRAPGKAVAIAASGFGEAAQTRASHYSVHVHADDAGAAESQCGTFQLIDKEGTTSWKLSRVAFPQLGDRTYTTRVEATTEGDIFRGGVIQIAGVSVGNNLVYVVYSAGPASRYEPTAVETFAKTTVDNLNAL